MKEIDFIYLNGGCAKAPTFVKGCCCTGLFFGRTTDPAVAPAGCFADGAAELEPEACTAGESIVIYRLPFDELKMKSS